MPSEDTVWVGIDGGGTRSRFLLTDTQGAVLGFALGGPLNINNVPEAAIAATLRTAWATLFMNTAPSGADVHVFAGVAGIKANEGPAFFAQIARTTLGAACHTITAVNDTDITLAGGLLGKPGIALILGTGSHCLGRNDAGDLMTCGGWGYLMDDCGSAYAIGLAGLQLAAYTWDGRRSAFRLAEAIQQHLGITRPEESLKRVYNQNLGHAGIKELARLVVALAEEGDEASLELLRTALTEAAEMVEVLGRQLHLGDGTEIVLTGAIALHPFIAPMLADALYQRCPGYRIATPALPPVAGAILRARQQAGETVDASFLHTLAQSLHPYLDQL